MILRRRALIGAAAAALPGVAFGAPCGEQERRKLLRFGELLIPDALACGSLVPSQAAAVGYNTQTFGPKVLPLGTALRPFSFFGHVPVTPVSNADGSITLVENSGGYGGNLCTASFVNGASTWQNFSGVAFGGGCYAEAVMSQTGGNVNPGMSFWLNDIESMNGGSVSTGGPVGDLTGRQWPGQTPAALLPGQFGYGNWIEVDIAEFDAAGDSYGCGNHNFYGTVASPQDANTGSFGGFVSPVTPGTSIDWSKPHRFGWLWVPASGSATQTNILPNSNETGVQVGNPGVLPAGWDMTTRTAGLQTQVTVVGTAGGFTTFDFRLHGTANGSDANLWFCPISGFAAPPSTNFTETVSLAVVAGVAPPNMFLNVDNLDSGGGLISNAKLTGITLTNTLTPYNNSAVSASNTARMNPQFGFFGPPNGTVVDVTFRISHPQYLQAGGGAVQGYQKFYFDGVQVGTTLTWNQWSAAQVPPPVQGTTAYNVLDTRHVAFIFGCGDPARPVTVYSLAVWQASAANNLSH